MNSPEKVWLGYWCAILLSIDPAQHTVLTKSGYMITADSACVVFSAETAQACICVPSNLDGCQDMTDLTLSESMFSYGFFQQSGVSVKVVIINLGR